MNIVFPPDYSFLTEFFYEYAVDLYKESKTEYSSLEKPNNDHSPDCDS